MSKTFPQRFRRYLRDNPELATIYAIMFFVIGLGALLSPEFRTPTNAFNVLRQAVAKRFPPICGSKPEEQLLH